jgi:hypothetical protein
VDEANASAALMGRSGRFGASPYVKHNEKQEQARPKINILRNHANSL